MPQAFLQNVDRLRFNITPLLVMNAASSTGTQSTFSPDPSDFTAPTTMTFIAATTGSPTDVVVDVELSADDGTTYLKAGRFYPLSQKKFRLEGLPGVLYRLNLITLTAGTTPTVTVRGVLTPGSPRSLQPGSGVIRSITGTNPIAGADIVETVPANSHWRLLSMSFQLVTNSTPDARTVSIILDDGTNEYSHVTAFDQTLASSTHRYTVSEAGFGGTTVGASNHLIAHTSSIAQPAGHRISTSIFNLKAGDNLSAPQLLVEEWVDE